MCNSLKTFVHSMCMCCMIFRLSCFLADNNNTHLYTLCDGCESYVCLPNVSCNQFGFNTVSNTENRTLFMSTITKTTTTVLCHAKGWNVSYVLIPYHKHCVFRVQKFNVYSRGVLHKVLTMNGTPINLLVQSLHFNFT